MRHRELLSAIGELEPATVSGAFQRHTSLRWKELEASAAGGRWGAPGAFEVLYLGRPADSVIGEAYRHLVDDEMDDAVELAAAVVERRLVTCDVDVSGVLDLRPLAVRATVGLDDADVFSPVGEYAPCQAVGAAAHQMGLTGVLAPAATRLGETLALFPTNLDVARWPTVAARDIWRGLPPDPRRLRLIEDDAG